MQMFKEKPWRSEKYKKFVRSHNCVVCMMPVTVSHHYRTAYNSGTGTKPSDYYCIPLCVDCHNEIHTQGVKTFCKRHGVDIYRELFLLISKYVKEKG